MELVEASFYRPMPARGGARGDEGRFERVLRKHNPDLRLHSPEFVTWTMPDGRTIIAKPFAMVIEAEAPAKTKNEPTKKPEPADEPKAGSSRPRRSRKKGGSATTS